MEKNEEIEQEIPVKWRHFITEIVDDIRERKLKKREGPGFEINVDESGIRNIYKNIDSYGDLLVRLPDDAWVTSICRWMGSYWHLLVDIFTANEGLSDLVLFLDVYENSNIIRFNILSVHVP